MEEKLKVNDDINAFVYSCSGNINTLSICVIQLNFGMTLNMDVFMKILLSEFRYC